MKIAQVSAYWGPAYPTGSGVFCYEISKRLAKQFEIHVFTSDIGNFNNPERIENLRVHPLRTYATIWKMNPVADVFTRLLRDDFDIIHVHSYIFFLSNMAALARLFKRKCQYILHFQGGVDFSAGSQGHNRGKVWVKENIYDRTLGYLTTKLADKISSTSRNDIPIIERKFGVRQVEWIPNAVDTSLFTPAAAEPKPPVVMYVGKLERWKGVDLLADCFRAINQSVPDAEFWVVGTGSMENELKKTDLPIKFLGHIPFQSMPEIYQKASVLVLPSYTEGFPCTLVEALSCSVPVVATDVGDNREIVTEGATGFLVKSGDAPGLASRIIEVIKDEGLRATLGRKGRQHVEKNFSYDVVTTKVMDMYQEIADARLG